jgi:hypothetical protein
VTAHVAWTQGGEATVLSLAGDRITVQSSVPSAPGSRPEGRIAGGARFWMKVARCRREGEAFVIDGRLLDTTRESRAAIAALLQP